MFHGFAPCLSFFAASLHVFKRCLDHTNVLAGASAESFTRVLPYDKLKSNVPLLVTLLWQSGLLVSYSQNLLTYKTCVEGTPNGLAEDCWRWSLGSWFQLCNLAQFIVDVDSTSFPSPLMQIPKAVWDSSTSRFSVAACESLAIF